MASDEIMEDTVAVHEEPASSSSAVALRASSPSSSTTQQSSVFEQVLQTMHLTNDDSTTCTSPNDANFTNNYGALVYQIMQWIQTQRPNYMFTTVLSLSVLLARMSRAFACRSSSTTNPATTSSNKTTNAAQPPAQPAPQPAATTRRKRKAFRSSKKLDLSPRVVESLKGFVADLAACIPLIVRHAQFEESRGAVWPGGFVPPQPPSAADLIDICLELLDDEIVGANNANNTSTTTTAKTTTAVNTTGKNNKTSSNQINPANAAMDLFRQVLSNSKSNNSNNNSTAGAKKSLQDDLLDQLKFKTFCVKTLESAQTRTIDVVESFYDFRFMWSLCRRQHVVGIGSSLQFHNNHQNNQNHNHNNRKKYHYCGVVIGTTTQEQEELAWKLACYLIWRRQEEHPDLCSRSERMSAGATSIILLSVFPFFHRHYLLLLSEVTNNKNSTPNATNNTSSEQTMTTGETANNTSSKNTNNHSVEETNNKDPASATTPPPTTTPPTPPPTTTMTTTTTKTNQGEANTSSSCETKQGEDTPAAEQQGGDSGGDDKKNKSDNTTSNDANKRPAEPDGDDDSHIKSRRVSASDATVHAGVPHHQGGDSSTLPDTNETLPAAAPPPPSELARVQPQLPCEACAKQERPLHVVMRATRQALSFLSWADSQQAINASKDAPSSLEEDMYDDERDSIEFSRAELDSKLLSVARHLATFSSFPIKESDSWFEVIKGAVGIKDDNNDTPPLPPDEIARNFLQLLEAALASMKHDEDERLGTRVEAVAYIHEFSLLAKDSKSFIEHLCRTVSNRPKQRNELIACVPDPSLPAQAYDKKLNAPHRPNSHPGYYRPEQQTTAVDPRLLMMDEAHNTFINHNRAVSPPVLTESMELNEWTIALLSSLPHIEPSPHLRSLLDKATIEDEDAAPSLSPKREEEGAAPPSPPKWALGIVPVLNRFLTRMHEAVDGPRTGPQPMTVNEYGVVQSLQRTQNTQLWAAIVQMYYHSLESILYVEKRAANAKLVMTEAFHEALMACCYLCIARAVTITGKMQLVKPESHQIYTIMPITGSTPYTYLKVTESFVRALTSTIADDATSKQLNETYGVLPRILQKEIKASEVYVIESLVWERDNMPTVGEGCIVNAIAELRQADDEDGAGQQQWPPECLKPMLPEELEDLEDSPKSQGEEKQQTKSSEFSFVSFIMRKLLKISYFRIQAICQELEIPAEYPVVSQIWIAFRFLLRNHVELLYGRHIDQWILCTIYGICKVMKYEPDLTFARVIEVYVSLRGKDLGERTCQAIVRQVTILDGTGGGEDNGSYGAKKTGNIIRLYNLVFVPIMKSYLLHSKSLRKSANALRQMVVDKEKKDQDRAVAGKTPNETVNSNSGGVSKHLREGNVSITVTLGGNPNSSGKSENDASMDSVPGTPPHSGQFTTFLQFGRATGAKRLSLANEMIAQGAP